jgi:hypothetical protein
MMDINIIVEEGIFSSHHEFSTVKVCKSTHNLKVSYLPVVWYHTVGFGIVHDGVARGVLEFSSLM